LWEKYEPAPKRVIPGKKKKKKPNPEKGDQRKVTPRPLGKNN